MKIVIKTQNLKLNSSLRKWIEEKLNSLEKFVSIFKPEIYFNSFFAKGKPRVEMWLEIGRETWHHQKGEIFRAEAQLRFPGKSIRSEAKSENLCQAICKIKDELQREFKEYKEKQIAKMKRGARRAKKELKLSPAAKFKIKRGQRIREEGI